MKGTSGRVQSWTKLTGVQSAQKVRRLRKAVRALVVVILFFISKRKEICSKSQKTSTTKGV